VDSTELLAHRILWSAVLAVLVLLVRDRGLSALAPLRDPRVLIAINWFVFIWAVTHDRVTETSLGYYTNPLINVLLGRVVLGERLRGQQAVAVGCAALGVAWMTLSLGALPWVSVALAFSFGTYGLVRKQAVLPPLAGLVAETGLCAPLCLAFLALGLEPAFGIARSAPEDIPLLVLGGAVTASPLLLFAVGARRLRYSTVGMLQYLAPTLQLALAALVFGEPFTVTHAVTFGFIWLAVALYAHDAWRHRPAPGRGRRRAPPRASTSSPRR
jgi:chloramphenicol-sensitive protein RarD